MKICFIRHGDDKAHGARKFDDLGLTFAGRREVARAAAYYKKNNIKVIYSSPLKRAYQSAVILSKKLKAPVVVMPELTERFKLQYTPNSPEEKEWWKNYLNYNYKNSKLETCKKYFDRIFKAIDEIKARHDDKDENILIVGHSANLYAMAAYFYGIPTSGKIIWMQCGNCARVNFETKINLLNKG
ncbi:MAG: histidine phosphatase family protein [Firmicutes bacterium]|nr:histidine phosphatase family protein [Bacillota bacterium]